MTEPSEKPERVPLVVRVLPETKAQFAASGFSMTKLVEDGAVYWEAKTLRMLTPEEQAAYMAGELRANSIGRVALEARRTELARTDPSFTATNYARPERRWKRDTSAPHVTMTCFVTAEAKLALDRYAGFYEVKLPDVLGLFGRHVGKLLRERMRRQRQLEQKRPQLDPEMATLMKPVSEAS